MVIDIFKNDKIHNSNKININGTNLIKTLDN